MQQMREKFNTYLEGRGLGSLRKRTRFQDYRESFHAVTKTGFTGVIAAFMGKPGAMEEFVSNAGDDLTRAYMGLQAMAQMAARGVSVQEMARMNSDQIRQVLPLKSIRGESYSDAQMHALATTIRIALQLPDIQALAGDDRFALELAMQKSYWNPNDLDDGLIETLGDFFCARNMLLFLLPMAQVKAGGELIAGSEWLARAVGWKRAMEWASTTGYGRKMVAMFEKSREFNEGLKGFTKVAWTIQTVVAAMVIQGVAVYGAETYGGPEVSLICEVLLLLLGNMEAVYELLRGSKIQPDEFARLLDKKYVPELLDQVKQMKLLEGRSMRHVKLIEYKQLKQLPPGTEQEVKLLEEEVEKFIELRKKVKETLDRLRGGFSELPEDAKLLTEALGPDWVRFEGLRRVIQKRIDGKPLLEGDIVLIQTEFGLNWKDVIPEGDAARDILVAYDSAIDQWIIGRRDGSDKAMKILAEEVKKQADDAEILAKNGKEFVKNRAEQALDRARFPKPFSADYSRLPGFIKANPRLQKAQKAMHAGSFDEAEESFFDALEEILDKTPDDHLRIQFVEDQIALCRRSKELDMGKLAGKADGDLSRAIEPDELRRVMDPNVPRDAVDARSGWRLIQESPPANANVWEHNGFIIKELPDPGMEMWQASSEGELFGAELAKTLGLTAPAVERVEQGGRVFLVSRKVKNSFDLEGADLDVLIATRQPIPKDLQDFVKSFLKSDPGDLDYDSFREYMTAIAFAKREELSKAKALSVLLGDYDRHLGNFRLTTSGGLSMIDQGCADLTGRVAQVRNLQPKDFDLHEGYWNRDHWFQRSHDSLKGNMPNAARQRLAHEHSLNFDDARPMVDEIRRLVLTEAGENQLRGMLTKTFQKTRPGEDVAELVEKSVRTLRGRAEELERTMRGLNERTGLPYKGFLPPSIRMRDRAWAGCRTRMSAVELGRAA
jgi:transcriptional regulator with XRE-family HTH domain